MTLRLFVFFWTILAMPVVAQHNIVFTQNLSFTEVKQLAKDRKKNVLIDTYADWCIPCKKMETEFRIKEVADFFNANYINVRINLDHEAGAEYRHVFDIVFLPTILILDPQGNIKYKTDKLISGRELKSIAEKCLDPSIFFQSDAASVSLNPLSGQTSESSSLMPERLVHVSGNTNPDYLYQEAYFRIELMDGSDKIAAKKYLATQSDWSTPKNIRFIFDFLNSSKTNDFQYFGENIHLFRKEIGEQIVNETLEIFIENELNFGYPKPNFERAKTLYSYLSPKDAEKKAFDYYTNFLLSDCKYGLYEDFINSYYESKTQNINPFDYYNLAEKCLEQQSEQKSEILNCLAYNTKATLLDNNQTPIFYEQAVLLHFLNGDKSSAKKSLKKAKILHEKNNTNSQLIDTVEAMLKK